MHLTLQTDGGSRGNPGPAAYGYVLFSENGEVLAKRGECMGVTTNNHAEYQAVVSGLTHARELGATQVTVQADSELVIRQLQGRYKVKHPRMQEMVAAVRAAASELEEISFEHIPRAKNAAADAEVNKALDEAGFVKKEFDWREARRPRP